MAMIMIVVAMIIVVMFGGVNINPQMAALKKRVDPTDKFRNKLWDAYYLQPSGQ